MNLYLALPMIACVSLVALLVSMRARDPHHPVNRVGAVLMGGAAFWAFCEVLWNSASDPERVLQLVRLSSVGWVAVGPLSLHLFSELTHARSRWLSRGLPLLHLTSAVFLALALTTDAIHSRVIPTS